MELDDPMIVYTPNDPCQAETIKAALRGEGRHGKGRRGGNHRGWRPPMKKRRQGSSDGPLGAIGEPPRYADSNVGFK